MKTIKFKAIIFDLDGTLLDTLKDLANSMNAVLSCHEMKTFPGTFYFCDWDTVCSLLHAIAVPCQKLC